MGWKSIIDLHSWLLSYYKTQIKIQHEDSLVIGVALGQSLGAGVSEQESPRDIRNHWIIKPSSTHIKLNYYFC